MLLEISSQLVEYIEVVVVPVAFISELCYHGPRILDLVLYKANIANSDNSARGEARTHDDGRKLPYLKKPRSLTVLLHGTNY